MRLAWFRASLKTASSRPASVLIRARLATKPLLNTSAASVPSQRARARSSARGGGGQARVGGQIQIIVGGEVDELAAAQPDARPLGGLQPPADAVQSAAAAVGQVVVEPTGHERFTPTSASESCSGGRQLPDL